jgi:hypothetical protein
MNSIIENSDFVFNPATKKDYPLKRIHKTTILCSCDDVSSIEGPYYIWITAAKRANGRVALNLYVGDESTSSNRRECLDAITVESWKETEEWFSDLDGLSGDRFDKLSQREIDTHQAIFRRLMPMWF